MTLAYTAWAVLIGLKALTVAHDFSWRTSIGVMATTALLLYVVAPILGGLAIAYLLL